VNRYETAARINREVNDSVSYRTDAAQYGRPEHWEPAGRLGDCEDYALLKRARLLEAGWDADKLALVTCRQPGGVGHVVLYVDTDDGAFILDNTQERPVSPMMLNYEWEAMLCGGEWRELRGWS
jgi:predicted transglutaminase-like cysteine proteinase